MKYARYAIGLALVGVGISVMVRARLGVAPFDVLNTGFSHVSGIALGTSILITNFAAILIAALLGEPVKLGTIASPFLVGGAVDLVYPHIPDASPLGLQIAYYIVALALITTSITLVVSSRVGPGASEMLMLGVARHDISLRWARTGTEICCVILGTLLGGQLGIGTLVFALSIGHLLAFTLPRAGFAIDQLAPAESVV